MRGPVGVVLLIAVTGCVYPEGMGPDSTIEATGDRPADWRQGVELSAYTSGLVHQGAGNVAAFPNTTSPGPSPATCKGYRDNQTWSGDTCTVSGRPQESLGRTYGPWTVTYAWSDNMPGRSIDDSRKAASMAGFDAKGQVVAFWDQRYDPSYQGVSE